MRLTIKAKQVAGVVSIVGLAVGALSGLYVSSLVRVNLEESRARGDLLAKAIFHRARVLVAGPERYAALRADEGLRSVLESSAYSRNVTYAAIADVKGVAIVHSDAERVGQLLPANGDLNELLGRGPLGQLRAIYSDAGKTLEVREPLVLGASEFGSIRIGVSTLLIRRDLNQTLRPVLITLLGALVASTVVATLLAQLLLRPIHLIRHSLARLGESDFGVAADLPRDEFGELGDSLAAVSARLLADRAGPSIPPTALEPVTRWLEDGVAVFNATGDLVLANARMRSMLPGNPIGQAVGALLSRNHPYRRLVEESLADRRSHGPLVVHVPDEGPVAPAEGGIARASEQFVRADVIGDSGSGTLAVMVVARDLEHLREVQSTLSYARRVATLGRLSAGLAHEIKNPLHATMIRLELLKQQLADDGPADAAPLLEHVSVIGAQMRRLDEVVQGFLKFIRPDELRLQPTPLAAILDGIMPIVEAEARSRGVTVRVECAPDVPDLSADRAMLEQAFLNLAINACQATPQGGTIRLAAAASRDGFVEVIVEDTGVGISPEHLEKIFDLYFTTKEGGSGIGLSMVFRAVHLHNGEIEVQSVPDAGTTFRLLLPQA